MIIIITLRVPMKRFKVMVGYEKVINLVVLDMSRSDSISILQQ